MKSIKELHPTKLWKNFANLSSIPRPSKKETKIINYLKTFGANLNLDTYVDEAGNVLIKKPATPGKEKRPTIVLQGHMDMVPQKNADVKHNFEQDGINMYIDGDWIKAKGTTLGADNGIGVAAAMTILESNNIPHPPIEALFTVDEETGLTGAQALKPNFLTGSILLNLDSEDDDELTIGCAGGVDISIYGTYKLAPVDENYIGYKIILKGLAGGHSGIQIHLGRANANKLMNRILYQASEKFDLRIATIDGGSLRNAIPRESMAEIVISNKYDLAFKSFMSEIATILKHEFSVTDPDLQLDFENISCTKNVMSKESQNKLLNAVYACPNGVYRMSADMEGVTQTSNNFARVSVKDGKYIIHCLARGAIDTEKMNFAQSIRSVFTIANMNVQFSGEYPGWIPNPNSPIVKLMSKIYTDLFNANVEVTATHGGLECGIIGKNYPKMDMVSFGPNIISPHSPDEKVQISSVQKFWTFLLEVLKQI